MKKLLIAVTFLSALAGCGGGYSRDYPKEQPPAQQSQNSRQLIWGN